MTMATSDRGGCSGTASWSPSLQQDGEHRERDRAGERVERRDGEDEAPSDRDWDITQHRASRRARLVGEPHDGQLAHTGDEREDRADHLARLRLRSVAISARTASKCAVILSTFADSGL